MLIFRDFLVLFKVLLLVSIVAISLPLFAGAEASPQAESPIAGIDWRSVEKMLAKHFSLADIESLKAYVKGAMMGLQTPMAPELKAKVRDFMTEMRLEYGFQFAVLMAELRKKVFRVLPPDLAELAEEFTQKPKTELEE
jgi:hypothetical protein